MSRVSSVAYEFVEQIPSELAEATVYISIKYRTTAHLCLCGCHEKIVNPLRPDGWAVTFDGRTLSLDPSIGNSGTACRSHYWIKRNSVKWLAPLTAHQVDVAFHRDGWLPSDDSKEVSKRSRDTQPGETRDGLLRRLLRRAR